jgi:hypothetical protein
VTKALLWIVVGVGAALLWTSAAGKKFVDELSVEYCSNYYDIHMIGPPEPKKELESK